MPQQINSAGNDEGHCIVGRLKVPRVYGCYNYEMPTGAVKLLNDSAWHQMSYTTESQFLIHIVSPPEAISYVFGATVEVRFADDSIRTGQGGQNGRVSFSK